MPMPLPPLLIANLDVTAAGLELSHPGAILAAVARHASLDNDTRTCAGMRTVHLKTLPAVVDRTNTVEPDGVSEHE